SIVHGYCIGGGSGIVLSSDIVLADSQSKFGFSEVAIGVVPAAIVDLLIEKAGQTKARELFLTGRRIKADEAERYGIVNYSLESIDLEQKLSETISYILNAAPKAMTTMKDMIRKYNAGDNFTKEYVAKVIAELRIGEEA